MRQLQVKFNNDYILVFHDGSKKQISQLTGEKILELSAGGQKKFTLHNQLYSFSNIAKLLPINEYYQQYPEEKSDDYKTFDQKYQPANFTKERRINAIKSMINGINIYINSKEYKGSDKPYELIKKMAMK